MPIKTMRPCSRQLAAAAAHLDPFLGAVAAAAAAARMKVPLPHP